MKTLAQQQCTAEILRRLKDVRPETARRWGRMTAHQMVCHLRDACRMALGEQPVTHATTPVPRALIKLVALYTPLRWRAGIPTSPEIDQECGGTKPGDFAADVAQLERMVRMVATRPRSAAWPPHPVFGRMSHREWLRWAYLHLDHHLRQFGA